LGGQKSENEIVQAKQFNDEEVRIENIIVSEKVQKANVVG
jgi:hypothetical protein